MSPAAAAQIPLPRPTALSRPHWEGCQAGVLRVQRCSDCRCYVFVPQPVCTGCLGPNLEWVDSTGRGRLYSYTIVHRPQQPVFETPYVPIIALLEEGWHMLSNLECSATTEIEIGMPLEVVFRKMSDEITLPYFKAAKGAR